MKRIYIGVFVVITLMLFCSCQMIPSDTISTTSYQTTLETTITLETTTQPANSKIQQRFEVIQEFDRICYLISFDVWCDGGGFM